MVGSFALLIPVVRALADRIRSKHDSGVRDEVRMLREDVAQELQQVRQELAELGERVDFAERLVAKDRGGERLAPPR